MTKKRVGDSWMPAPEYGAGLRSLSINVVVRDIERALRFQQEVLEAHVVYRDPDIAVLTRHGAEWMLHADHTYDAHPLHAALVACEQRGLGCEIRLHDHDPDAAEARARKLGYEIVQSTADKPHGLRECFIRDSDGYVWVPDQPVTSA